MSLASLIAGLIRARDSIGQEIENEQARRTALTAAGKPPPVTYSVDGRNVQWGQWLKEKLDALKAINDEIARLDTGEGSLIGYSGY